jgi:integrase
MNEPASARRGWRETIEPGIYRRHRADCPSSGDHRRGRRCSCSLQVAAPGSRPRETRLVTIAGATVTEARQERRRLLAAGRPTAEPVAAGPATVHELAVVYLRARSPQLAPSTVRTIEDAYRLRVAPTLRDLPLPALTRARVDEWVGGLLAGGSSPHATRQAVAALRLMCSYAVELRLLPTNPCSRVRVPEPPADPDAPPPVERVLTPHELELLLAVCETLREQAIVRLAAESGLRSGEVRGLRWPDVELLARRVRVRRAVWRDVVKLPKSNRPRRVAITRALADCLAEMYRLEVVERGRPEDGYVFVARDGRSPMSSDTPLEVAQRVQVRAGVVRPPAKPDRARRPAKPHAKVTYHELRHTAATIMLTASKPLPVVARQLGHASSKITAAVYEHLLDDALLDDALDAFESSSIARRIARSSELEVDEAANRVQ